MEATEKKTYKIGEREFMLRENLTLRQRDSISAILKKFRLCGSAVMVELQLNELASFFCTILQSKDDKKTAPAYFEEYLDEKIEIEVVSDFFIQRINLTSELMNRLQDWRKNLNESRKILNS